MSHVFISYVREDQDIADQLALDLRSLGVKVWLDKDSIHPGERWKDAIRKAIREGDFFLCCFSANSESRSKTYMNEELIVAIEELRSMPTHRTWFIPVKLSPCTVPSRSIGAGETLQDIQCIDLYANDDPVAFLTKWRRGVMKIVSVINGPIKKSVDVALKSLEQRPAFTFRSVGRNDISIKEAITMIQQNDFYEKDWNPLGGDALISIYYLLSEERDGIVAAPTTGLLWQQKAKHFLIRRAFLDANLQPSHEPQREDHIEGNVTVEDQVALLNQSSYAGFCDWRLPTLEEALSIIDMNGRVDYRFGEPRPIWTSDFASENLNWVVDYIGGSCYPLDILDPMTAHFSVRVVRTWMVD